MNISSWLQSLPVRERQGAVDQIASACRVTPAAVRHWANGIRRISPDQAALVEAATAGCVRVEELCPSLIWNRDQRGRVTGYTVPVSIPEAA